MTKDDISVGDVVMLNDLARPHFRREVSVDEVRSWGIVCHYTDAQGGAYYYRAPWEQIKGLAL